MYINHRMEQHFLEYKNGTKNLKYDTKVDS